MKFRTYLHIVTFLSLVSCEKKPVIDSNSSQTRNGILLIFEQIPENSRYEFPNGIKTNNGDFELQYLDDHLIPHYISPNPDLVDTIKIDSHRKIIEVQHAYRGVDKLSFFFFNGDTVSFTYQDKLPIATVKNRKTQRFDVNYEGAMRNFILKNDFPSSIKYRVPFAFHRFVNEKKFKAEYEKIVKSFKEETYNELRDERVLLDSLIGSDAISLAPGILFKLQNTYDSICLVSDFVRLGSFPVNHLETDSLLFFGFYNDFLDAILFKHYVPKTQMIKSGNVLVPDFEAVYDSIKNDRTFTKATRLILLRKALKQIVQNSDVASIKKYADDFLYITNDSVGLTYLNNKFRLNFDSGNQLSLLRDDGSSTTLDNLLEIHKGNIVYVDFWASWCAPCISQFPNSHLLREKYRNKNISFIYLSIDSDSLKWMKASTKYKLDNSYLINNRFSSLLLKELNVSAIPRYLLYDRNGRIVHKNAPRPGDTSIVKLIDSYLK